MTASYATGGDDPRLVEMTKTVADSGVESR
jgi:hypothetical protein